LFAGTLRDLIGAVLVGELTTGKVFGQRYPALANGGSLSYTTLRYFLPRGQFVKSADGTHIGLLPDVEVEARTDEAYLSAATRCWR
jgi:C-terminal processing protease CtpA/Prc